MLTTEDYIVKALHKQNEILERIAKVLERAFPPLIITATDKFIEPTELKELIELREPTCTEETIAMGFRIYDPITMKWSDE